MPSFVSVCVWISSRPFASDNLLVIMSDWCNNNLALKHGCYTVGWQLYHIRLQIWLEVSARLVLALWRGLGRFKAACSVSVDIVCHIDDDNWRSLEYISHWRIGFTNRGSIRAYTHSLVTIRTLGWESRVWTAEALSNIRTLLFELKSC